MRQYLRSMLSFTAITLCTERVMVQGEPAKDRITGHRYFGKMTVKTDKNQPLTILLT